MLLIDIGNTKIKWTYILNAEQKKFVIESDFTNNFQFNLNISAMASLCVDVKIAVIANVSTNYIGEKISKILFEEYGISIVFLRSTSIANDVINSYDNYAQLGIDRWLNIIGARQLYKDNCIVLSCGTAITADIINKDGHYLGGLVLPGIQTMKNCLVNNCDKITNNVVLTENKYNEKINIFAKNSTDCIYNGILFAVTNFIHSLCNETSYLLTENIHCVITGGDGEFLCQLIQNKYNKPVFYHSDLLFQGMRAYINFL